MEQAKEHGVTATMTSLDGTTLEVGDKVRGKHEQGYEWSGVIVQLSPSIYSALVQNGGPTKWVRINDLSKAE